MVKLATNSTVPIQLSTSSLLTGFPTALLMFVSDSATEALLPLECAHSIAFTSPVLQEAHNALKSSAKGLLSSSFSEICSH